MQHISETTMEKLKMQKLVLYEHEYRGTSRQRTSYKSSGPSGLHCKIRNQILAGHKVIDKSTSIQLSIAVLVEGI